MGRLVFIVWAAVVVAGCAAGEAPNRAEPTSGVTTPSIPPAPEATTVTTPTPTTARPAPPPTTAPSAAAGDPVTVSFRAERRTTDEATATFEEVVASTLTDVRGWERAGFRFVAGGPAAPFLLVLAEGDEVDRLCLPYDTYGLYSCQNGPVVAINADRWRTATPKWTGDLGAFRQMLVNHEVGHLLGQKHPRPQCPRAGQPAPIMNQQSTELNGCLPNPWPLDAEVEVAARHDRPLAPGYER